MSTYRRYERRDVYASDEEDGTNGPPPRNGRRGSLPPPGVGRRGPPPLDGRRGGGREEIDDYSSTYERRDVRERSRGPPPFRGETLVRERERERDTVIEEDRNSRVPAFMRDDRPRNTDAGPLVLRRRDVETIERPRRRRSPSPSTVVSSERLSGAMALRRRSPSPIRRGGRGGEIREREEVRIERREESRGPPLRRRSPSPIRRGGRGDEVREREEIRIERREESRGPPLRRRDRSDSPETVYEKERVRTRVVERDDFRRVERSPSPLPPPPVREREVERTRVMVEEDRYRERSPTPPPPVRDREIERTRVIVEERRRAPSPSPSPSPPPSPPPPPVIREPTIEREIITHYRNIDHGTIVVRDPSPSPPPPVREPRRRVEDTKLDIEISHVHGDSREETDIDIRERRSKSRVRERSRSRTRRRQVDNGGSEYYHRDDIKIDEDRNHLKVEVDHEERRGSRGGGRRARSAVPLEASTDYSEEAEYITNRINERGRMGEARYGATKDWTIVDVPPGTERVRMDGAGGGGADVTWQRYNGVRRAKFVATREEDAGALVLATPQEDNRESTTIDISHKHREREGRRERRREGGERDKLTVEIVDKHEERGASRGGEREHDLDIEIEQERRIVPRQPVEQAVDSGLWTEITKDLVIREAIETMGYDFEETEFFYYVMQYLRYEDVLQLVDLSDDIRRTRKARIRELEYQRRDLRPDYGRKDEIRRSRSSHYHHADYDRNGRMIDHYDRDRRESETVYDDRPRRYR